MFAKKKTNNEKLTRILQRNLEALLVVNVLVIETDVYKRQVLQHTLTLWIIRHCYYLGFNSRK